jgi:DNA-binding transcriptional MocR family regulator
MTPNQSAYQAVQFRRSLPYGQRPTDLHVRIAFLLARWQNPCPSHAKLARAAHCHRNSVLNALHRLRDLGLLTWERQWNWIRGHAIQTVNRYRFMSDAQLPKSRFRQREKNEKSSSLLGRQLLCSGRPLLPVRTVAEQLALL